MNTDQIIVNPSEDDLMITGYLKNIDVKHFAFTVFYELYFEEQVAESYNVRSKTYPLKYLPDFFKVNSELPLDFYCPRVREVEPVKKIRNDT